MELEKKKKVTAKVNIKGPIIRYHSVTMPLVKSDNESDHINDDDDENQNLNGPLRQSRNFISFTDENTFRQNFPKNKALPYNQPKTCVITGLSAKYFDPLTQCGYHSLSAFKALREMHAANKLKQMSI